MTHHPDDQARATRIAWLSEQANLARREATHFRQLAAVPDHEKPPVPPIPADIDKIVPEAIWPSLSTSSLLLLARYADMDAASHDREIRRLLAIPATPTNKEKKQ